MAFDSDIEDDIMLLAVAAVVKINSTKKRRKLPRFSINPYLRMRKIKGRFANDFGDLRNYTPSFRENFHMDPSDFDTLLSLVEPLLKPKYRARCDAYSAKEKLAMTLEYLASGSYQRHVASVYRASKQTFGRIIEDTCKALYKTLKTMFLADLKPDDWLDKANQFHALWNLPNCLGAIDGKHIGIVCPKRSGSVFYNYKGFFSIVLMAVGDADYRFTFLDIGAYGSEGDSTIFRNSEFGKALVNERLNIPPDAAIQGENTPFFFVGDDAFPLHQRILKPYTTSKTIPTLSDEETIFNYRLSRARRCIENSFGILCCRWRILARTMHVSPDRAQIIAAACCLLHNFLIKESRQSYCPDGFSDEFRPDGQIVQGTWRKTIPENSCFHANLYPAGGRPTELAKSVRDRIKHYVNSEAGSVPWQTLKVLGV